MQPNFSISQVVGSQKSTPPNGLAAPNELKMEGSLFWETRNKDNDSQPDLDFEVKKEHFSRANSNLTDHSGLGQKKIVGAEFNLLMLRENVSGKRSTLKGETQETPSIMNKNVVRNVEFDMPEPSIEKEIKEEYSRRIDRSSMEQKFERKCKKLSENPEKYTSNFFSFHEMKAHPKKTGLRGKAQNRGLLNFGQAESEGNCFYTNLFLKSNKNFKKHEPKETPKKQKTHVNLSTLNIKKDTSINNCRITGSRRGSRKDLNDILPSVYSTQYPHTEPRKMALTGVQIPPLMFGKLQGDSLQAQILGTPRRPSGMTELRKPRTQLNRPLTPSIRFIRLDPGSFQTPESRRNLNLVLDSLQKLQAPPQQRFFPKSQTMADLQVLESSKRLADKPKKVQQKGSKLTTPKVKRKVIKKKSKGGTSKKKKGGCRCKKTHCTRLHCICFREKGFCDDSCSCTNCYNRPKFKDMISHIRELTEEINPLAFKSKIQVIETQSGQKIHNRGCSCTKNNCRKNYCECFKNGLPCSPLCKCENCKNDHVKLEAEEVKRIFKKCSRKKKKFVIEIGKKNPEVHNIQMS